MVSRKRVRQCFRLPQRLRQRQCWRHVGCAPQTLENKSGIVGEYSGDGRIVRPLSVPEPSLEHFDKKFLLSGRPGNSQP
ncbi:hypothetical protein JOB18_043417 [Solea senegalensis]|uniref:Uncharacterized protein n=1 Tax=Solea senegalensis TaxID=28829 RepID=A0AAV6RIB3_SOLSE|nr:hypothetical protein JOB18_043417 [Solea senegalensis]